MGKRLLCAILATVSLLLSSCGLIFSEDGHAANQAEAVVSALAAKDSEGLKALFSQKALEELGDWDGQFDALSSFLAGDIISWEADDGRAGSETDEHGKKTIMLRYSFRVLTDLDEYDFFLIDYAVDTIAPDNQGLYMMEVHKTSYDGEWEAWQNRLTAGISIIADDQ